MKQATKTIILNHLRLAVLICSLPALVSCAHVNVNQIAYEVLRQEDCRRNQLESFCTRTFASEYHEYERIRQEFIRQNQEQHWLPWAGELKMQGIAEAGQITTKTINAL